MRRVIVISDLHIGGESLPMLGHPELLCDFLRQLTNYKRTPGEEIELVINGDFVDFLAIEPYAAWTPEEDKSIAKLEQAKKQFPEVFQALSECIARLDYFTVLLGNHDIESGCPRVLRALLEMLGTNPHRCLFIASNQAYRCGDLLIEHGNRYDAWNAIDYEDFHKVVSRLSRSEDAGGFEVCPGSQMVEQMVNPLKPDYPFLDLLKPETKVLPLLLTSLEPSLKYNVKRIYGVFRFWAKQLVRTRSWIPVITTKSEKLIAAAPVHDTLPQDLQLAFNEELSALKSTEQLISANQIWTRLKGSRPESAAFKIRNHKPIEDEQLERIRLSLGRALEGDRTFDDDGPDGPYLEAARKLVNGEARPRVVLMGHTHQIREVKLNDGNLYLNTGTWVDLIKVQPKVLQPGEEGRAALDQWLRQLLLDTKSLRDPDPAYADITLDQSGKISQPENRPLLRRLASGPFSA